MSFNDPRLDLKILPQDRKLKPEQQKIVAAAREFESVMIEQLLRTMRTTTHPSGIDGGSAMANYRDMLDGQMAQEMARGGGLGLSEIVSRQLLGLDARHPQPAAKPAEGDAR